MMGAEPGFLRPHAVARVIFTAFSHTLTFQIPRNRNVGPGLAGLSPFDKWGNCGWERWSDLARAAELVRSRSRLGSWSPDAQSRLSLLCEVPALSCHCCTQSYPWVLVFEGWKISLLISNLKVQLNELQGKQVNCSTCRQGCKIHPRINRTAIVHTTLTWLKTYLLRISKSVLAINLLHGH